MRELQTVTRRRALKATCGMISVPTFTRATRATTESYEPIGRLELRGTREMVLSDDGNTAFVAVDDGFATVDVSDPASPRLLAERRNLLSDREDGPLKSIWDVKLDGDRLVVFGPGKSYEVPTIKGFLLYDVADPADPRQLAFYETDYRMHNGDIAGGMVYIFPYHVNEISIIDVRDGEPTEISRWVPEGPDGGQPQTSIIHDITVQDGIAYVPFWDAGTWILDVRDPEAPEYIGHIPVENSKQARASFKELPGNHGHVDPSADGSMIAISQRAWDMKSDEDQQGSGGVMLWDISDEENPQKLATIDAPDSYNERYSKLMTTSHELDLAGDRLYTAYYRGGVKVHDVSDPANPKELAWWRDPDVGGFWSAQHATDSYFVASSSTWVDYKPRAKKYFLFEGLMTFPNEAGTQANPPSLETTPTPSKSPTPTDTPASVQTSMQSATPAKAASLPSESTRSRAPGFGILVGLTVLGGAAWRLLRAEQEN